MEVSLTPLPISMNYLVSFLSQRGESSGQQIFASYHSSRTRTSFSGVMDSRQLHLCGRIIRNEVKKH
jgi:hypothetical protein